MVYKFYDVAYVSKAHTEYLRRTISYNEVLKTDLMTHLAKIYEQDRASFQTFGDFAFMDTTFHDLENQKLFAYFVLNQHADAKQTWFLQGFKTEYQIEELCNPEEPEEEKEEEKKPEKKTIIQDVKTYFDETPLNNKSSVKNLLDIYRKEHAGNDQRDGVIFERMLTQAIIENDALK